MMVDDSFALAVMGASVALAATSSVLFYRWDFAPWRRARAELVEAIEVAEVEDELRDVLIQVEQRVHYRHDVHCPVCGRFSRRVEGFPDQFSDCGEHGIQMRVGLSTGPIQVIIQPADEMTLEDLNIPEPFAIV